MSTLTYEIKSKSNGKANLTLSLENQILDELKKEADLNGSSLNSKVNSVLTKYVRFYRISEELGSSIIPGKLWMSMLDLLNEKDLMKLINSEGIGAIYSIFVNNNTPMTLDNFIKYGCQEICLWSGMYSTFRYFKDKNNNYTLIFEHKFGIKWSNILENAFVNIIRIMLNHTAESQILQNTVKITISK